MVPAADLDALGPVVLDVVLRLGELLLVTEEHIENALRVRLDVAAEAGLPRAVVGDGLHANARGIGGDTESRRERVLAHRRDDGCAEPITNRLLPARQGATIDRDPVAAARVLDAEQRH